MYVVEHPKPDQVMGGSKTLKPVEKEPAQTIPRQYPREMLIRSSHLRKIETKIDAKTEKKDQDTSKVK